MSVNLAHIYLGQGKWATVDADNYQSLSVYVWQCERKKRSWYAFTIIHGRKGPFKLYMHRLIASTPANMVTHHKNRNSLYNTRVNLVNMLRNNHKLEHINNPIKIITEQTSRKIPV